MPMRIEKVQERWGTGKNSIQGGKAFSILNTKRIETFKIYILED